MSSFLVLTVLRTSSFFLCSVQDTFNMRRQIRDLNVSILFMSFFCNVHVSLPYNAILHTNALATRFFQLEAERSTHFLLIESFLCQCNATSCFAFASAVLSHHTSKVAELCDWLQFITVDHYSQLFVLPLWHSHNRGFSDVYFHVVFLWRLLECIGQLYALKSTLGMRDHSLVVCKTDGLYQYTCYFDPFLYIC